MLIFASFCGTAGGPRMARQIRWLAYMYPETIVYPK
jgi:hypothetical protein